MSHTLSVYFPAGFFALILAHFVALISPGADFFLIVGNAVRSGFKGSAGICFGIAFANALYIILAIVGWAVIKDYPVLFTLTECLGACYLLYIGWQLLKSKNQGDLLQAAQSHSCLSLPGQLLTGFLSGMLNPKNLIFYMSLMTSILGDQVTLTQQTVCGLWLFCAVLLWDLLIAYMIGHPQVTNRLNNKIYLIERTAGGILILIASGIVYHLTVTTFLNS